MISPRDGELSNNVSVLKTYFLILLSILSADAYAQSPDSLKYKLDSVRPVLYQQSQSIRKARYLLPAVGLIYGFTAQKPNALNRFDRYLSSDIKEDYPGFQNHLDDKLQYSPVAAVYALEILGVTGKNNIFDKTAIFTIAHSIMGVSVGTLKTQTHKLRPDGSDFRSFPSGHTATAFAAAEFMRQEYKDVSPWYGIAAYTAATATGTLRMVNDKHWFSDVAAGAGVGVLSTKLAYWTFPIIKKTFLKHKDVKSLLVPTYQQGVYGFYFSVPLK